MNSNPSIFRTAGYQDGLDGLLPSPPLSLHGITLFAAEYREGYDAGKRDREKVEREIPRGRRVVDV